MGWVWWNIVVCIENGGRKWTLIKTALYGRFDAIRSARRHFQFVSQGESNFPNIFVRRGRRENGFAAAFLLRLRSFSEDFSMSRQESTKSV